MYLLTNFLLSGVNQIEASYIGDTYSHNQEAGSWFVDDRGLYCLLDILAGLPSLLKMATKNTLLLIHSVIYFS